MRTKKRPALRGLSDATLLALARRVVMKRWGWTCVICGEPDGLDVHHIIPRRVRCLRYDPDNLVPVHRYQTAPGSRLTCHDYAASLKGHDALRRLLGDEVWDKLQEKQGVLKRDEMLADGLSESQWRRRWKAALEAELKGEA